VKFYFNRTLSLVAKKDDTDYSIFKGYDIETPEGRANYFYYKNPPKNYRVEIPDPTVVRIILKVDPCRLKGDNDLCCNETNAAACEDNTEILGGTDIGVAWFTNGYILKCSDSFAVLGTCGTFFEIHRPNDPKIIESYKIDRSYSSGFVTEFISTKNLCAGSYEFWFVLRTRNGSIL
jgi:hypothetical protein